MLFFGAVTIGFLALASIFSSGLLMGFAVKSLVFLATLSLGVVAGSGWQPEEYMPKRIVVNVAARRTDPAREPDEAVV